LPRRTWRRSSGTWTTPSGSRRPETATDYDVLAAEVAVENARPAVIRAQNAVRVSREQLRFLLAESSGEIDAAGSLVTEVSPPPPYEDVLAQALKNRPDLGEIASQRGVYTELVTIARAAGKPRVDFSAALGARNLGLQTLSATGTTWNAAIVATVPLFDGERTKGRVAQAQIDLSRIKLDELKLRDGVTLEVRVAVNAAQEAAENRDGARGTVKQAETLLALAERATSWASRPTSKSRTRSSISCPPGPTWRARSATTASPASRSSG